MTEDKPSPEELERRGQWFERYVDALDNNSVKRPPKPGVKYACPCCKYLTLRERGGDDICVVCFWHDDGQDDHDAADVRGGPNGSLSLAQARANFAEFGASEHRRLPNVRPPSPEEEPEA